MLDSLYFSVFKIMIWFPSTFQRMSTSFSDFLVRYHYELIDKNICYALQSSVILSHLWQAETSLQGFTFLYNDLRRLKQPPGFPKWRKHSEILINFMSKTRNWPFSHGTQILSVSNEIYRLLSTCWGTYWFWVRQGYQAFSENKGR